VNSRSEDAPPSQGRFEVQNLFRIMAQPFEKLNHIMSFSVQKVVELKGKIQKMNLFPTSTETSLWWELMIFKIC
jgi:hypothetical protein